MTNISFEELDITYLQDIIPLIQVLNPNKSADEISQNMQEMFTFSNYKCFGLFDGEKLVGLTSAWITVRFYSGKQLEMDNFVVDSGRQSSGYGKMIVDFVEEWAKNNDCKTIELNTYVANSRSHKFYFFRGFSILGFHFQKKLG